VPKPHSSGANGLIWEKKPDPAEVHWANIGHARTAVALAALDVPGEGARVFCVTRDAKLWCRDLNAQHTSWQAIATGCGATNLAAVIVPGSGPKLFCTTADNLVYVRAAVPTPAPWHCVGDALGVIALTALEMPGEGPKLYCATDHNLLYRRDAVGSQASWEVVGDAACVSGLAALDVPGQGPQLLCATTHHLLYRRSALAADTAWEQVGRAVNVVAMAAASQRLLCLTTGELLSPLPHQVFLPVRKKVDITGNVRSEEPRRITITDEFGNRVGAWGGENTWDIEPTPYFAEQGSTPGVVVLEVLCERQYDGDPTWYGMRCMVSHQRGGSRNPEELTVAAEDCKVNFRWSR
jgi:hypothetical protein